MYSILFVGMYQERNYKPISKQKKKNIYNVFFIYFNLNQFRTDKSYKKVFLKVFFNSLKINKIVLLKGLYKNLVDQQNNSYNHIS